MNVGTRYTLALLASIDGKLSINAGTLVAITDSTSGTASQVITEHNATRYRLPDSLKAIDIHSQLFFHFREDGGTTYRVIPEAYINQATVVAVTQLSKTVVFSLSTVESYAQLVRILDDNGFQYRVV